MHSGSTTLEKMLRVLTFAITGVLAGAQTPLLVDTDWLAAHLSDPGLVLLHIGPKEAYDANHIRGARHLTLDDIAKPRDPKELTLELPTPEVLRAKLESFGIGDNSRIVVYFGAKQVLQSSTRVIFTLDYLGLPSSLLNGGLPAWTAAGKAVTTDVPAAAKPGKLSARPTKNLVVDAEFVKAVPQHKDQRLVDARLPNFYKGTDATYEKNGHIPNAINLPFAELMDDKLMLDRERIEKLFTAAGIQKNDTVVAYCHIGQQATAVIFASRLLGHPVKLYDGSFEDWAKNARGPVEK